MLSSPASEEGSELWEEQRRDWPSEQNQTLQHLWAIVTNPHVIQEAGRALPRVVAWSTPALFTFDTYP